MQLTRRTDYSLRVLVYLGLFPHTRSTVTAIARYYGISRNHLVKVVHRLAQLGFVATQRGKTGGVRLARASSEIVVGDVVRQTESHMALVECLSDGSHCRLDCGCPLKGMLSSARDRFLEELDSHTLADIVSPLAAVPGLHAIKLAVV